MGLCRVSPFSIPFLTVKLREITLLLPITFQRALVIVCQDRTFLSHCPTFFPPTAIALPVQRVHHHVAFLHSMPSAH